MYHDLTLLYFFINEIILLTTILFHPQNYFVVGKKIKTLLFCYVFGTKIKDGGKIIPHFGMKIKATGCRLKNFEMMPRPTINYCA